MPRLPRKTEPSSSSSSTAPGSTFPSPALQDKSLRMTYRIARGEQGVLTFEPYKSILLPHWRFKSIAIAEESSQTLYSAFTHYVKAGDFVGADMARKFIQMGMTRAKRYANHKGGRKYDAGRKELPKSTGHEGREEKLAASEVFKAVWRRSVEDEEYTKLKKEFLEELKQWVKSDGADIKQEEVKSEEVEEG